MSFPQKLHKIAESIQPQDIVVFGSGFAVNAANWLDVINGVAALFLTGATLIYTCIRIAKILEKNDNVDNPEQ